MLTWLKDNRRVLLAALATKLALAFVVLSAFNGFRYDARFRLLESGDTPGYLRPAENWVSAGVWAYDAADPRTCAARPPAYGLVYAAFRRLAPAKTAEFLLSALQVVLSAGAAVAFGEVVLIVSASPLLAMAAVALHLGSIQLLLYDLRLITESFSVSLSIFALLLLLRNGYGRTRVDLAVGCLLAFVVFLRPFLGVALPILAAHALLRGRPDLSRSTRTVAALLAPFTLAFACWTAWCYVRTQGHLVFMQSSFPVDYFGRRPYSRFVDSWGGESADWVPDSPAAWFAGKPIGERYRFPQVVLSGVSYTQTDLESVRTLVIRAGRDRQSPEFREAAAILDGYAAEFKRAHPLYGAFVAPLRILYRYAATLQNDDIFSTNLYARVRAFRWAVESTGALLDVVAVLGLLAWRRRGNGATEAARAFYWPVFSLFFVNTAVQVLAFHGTEGRCGLVPLWLIYPWGLDAARTAVRAMAAAPVSSR